MRLINKLATIFYLFCFGWSTSVATVVAITETKGNVISCSSQTDVYMTKIHWPREAKLFMRPGEKKTSRPSCSGYYPSE